MQNNKTEISIPLGKVHANTDVTIKSISGDKRFITRIISMGIMPGSELFIVRNHKIGPIIIFLRDSFIAIGRRETGNIMVEI